MTAPKLRYKDGKGTLRYVIDTPENRKKYAGNLVSNDQLRRKPQGVRAARSVPPGAGVPDPTAHPAPETGPAPIGKPSLSKGEGDQKARAALAAVGVGGPAPGAPAPVMAPTVSYSDVVKIINGIITLQFPQAAMTLEEIQSIGIGVDAVVAKRWPSMQDAGPELALILALAAYLTRILLPLLSPPPPVPMEEPPPLTAPGA